MIHFSASLDGVPQLDRAFNRVEEYIDDFRNVWPSIITLFYTDFMPSIFASEGGTSTEGAWAGLSKAYARFKEVAFPGQTLLKATTSLFDSLTDPEASGAILRPERDQLTLGSGVPYVLAHHRGSSKRNLPRRSLNPFTELNKRKIQKAIQLALVQFVRRQGFVVLERAA